MMKLSDLAPETIKKIKSVRWDRIIEKHEGPEDWESVLRYYDPEFMTIDGHSVLLPISASHHPNITILRSFLSADGNSLTIFLTDTTHDDDPFFSGFITVCDRMTSEKFFLSILFHEWFVIDSSSVFATNQEQS